MHFSSILPAALCLAASANAVALPETQGQGYSLEVKKNVTIIIYEWLADIAAVNKFVDTVGFTTDPKLISVMAAAAYPAAKNEGASNTIISSEVTLDATGEAASKALPAKFNIIGPAINDTIFHPENVKKNVAAVNAQRYAFLIRLCIGNIC
jgi:hypothetical protein